MQDDRQDSWRAALYRGSISGSAASVLSTAVVALCSRREAPSAASATNATSHWLWGRRAKHQHGVNLRYTATGYLIHHASSIFWAAIYERYLGKTSSQTVAAALPRTAAVAALACITDYRLTPARLTPGFEQHLSKRSLFAVYAGFAVGMALGHALLKRRA